MRAGMLRPTPPIPPSRGSQKAVEWVRVKFAFNGENDAELTMKVGDIIQIVNKEDEGWWEGELNGVRGLFPSNYVETCAAPTNTTTNKMPATPTATNTEMKSNTSMFGVQLKTPVASNIFSQHNHQPSQSTINTTTTMSGMPAGTRLSATGSIVQYDAKPLLVPAPHVNKTVDFKKSIPKGKTKFGLWASNMAYLAAYWCMPAGCFSMFWYFQMSDTYNFLSFVAGVYALLLGGGILLYENNYGDSRKPTIIPIRFIVYVLLSVLLFYAVPTIMGGIFLLCSGIINLIACILKEEYESPVQSAAQKSKEVALVYNDSFIAGLIEYLTVLKQQNKVGTLIFLLGYFVINCILYGTTVKEWVDLNLALRDAKMSEWAPFAKGFGKLLDFNCAIILLPVCRTILRGLYNLSTADQGIISKTVRLFLYFVPLDKNLAFHRLIASVIIFAAVGHIGIHCINVAIKPTQTLNVFGLSPWISGCVICLAMLFIYSAAFDNVKRGQFEIFWYSHHCFIIFFCVLLGHGKGGLNPNFWKFFLAPGILYLAERILRFYRSTLPVPVLSVTLMDEVISLEFAKEGVFEEPYREGQYIFIQAPSVSRIQWHPFTISSAPQEKTVTVHIRMQGEGSWTRNLATYIGAMGPKDRSYFLLDRQGPSGKIPGKLLGPDGRPMLCLDGPYSAPTQHMPEYTVAMIMGAGIGVTPVAACLKSVIFQRWRLFMGECFPNHAYFYWVCAHKDIDAFRWLIRIIKEAQDEVLHMRATNPTNMASKSFEFHIYITSTPKNNPKSPLKIDDEIGFWGVPREDAKVEKVRATWDESNLYSAMKYPTIGSHAVLNDIHIWEGRPKWDPHFKAVGSKHHDKPIGVCFCGNPFIGKDLRRMCYTYNRGRKQGLFNLHKENF